MGSNPIAPILQEMLMNQHSDPIEFLIDFAWANGADRFVVNNAKDELKRLRDTNDFRLACWARINSRGDLYDPRFLYNPHLNESTILPLYANQQEFEEKYGKLSQ